MVVLERKALAEPRGKYSSHGKYLESSKLGESPSGLFPAFDDTGYYPLDEYFSLGSGSAFRLSTTIV